MSVEAVEQVCKELLCENKVSSICIKGDWGIGKTHFWKKFLRDHAREVTRYRMYSYVSLYGINSIDDLRNAILQNMESFSNLENRAQIQTAQQTAKNIFNTMVGVLLNKGDIANKLLSLHDKKNASNLYMQFLFGRLRGCLVCFDDIERKGKSISAREILGLATFIREEKNCGTCIILNDNLLNRKDKSHFDNNVEKSSELVVKFEGNTENSFYFSDLRESEFSDFKLRCVSIAGVTNIRVLNKIHYFCGTAESVLSEFSANVKEKVAKSIILSCWSVYQTSDAPTPDFIKNYNRYYDWREDKETKEQYRRWQPTLSEYGYEACDDLDFLIISGVENGFFDCSALIQCAIKFENEIKSRSIQAEYRRLWENDFHGDLCQDDDIFLEDIFYFARSNIRYLTVRDLNGALRVLRKCDRNTEADKIIDSYVDEYRDKGQSYFDVDKIVLASEGMDDKFQKRLNEIYNEFAKSCDLKEVVFSMVTDKSFPGDGMDLISRMTAIEMVAFFESLSGDDLKNALEHFRTMSGLKEEPGPLIQKNFHEALDIIAAKSPLRALKVQRYRS